MVVDGSVGNAVPVLVVYLSFKASFLWPSSHYTTLESSGKEGALGVHTARLVRDGSVQTMQSSLSGGMTDCVASNLQLKYRKIRL